MKHYSSPGIERDVFARQRQQRRSLVISFVASILTVVAVLVILALILLPSRQRITPTIVSYQVETPQEEEVRPNPVAKVQPKPAAPSMAMAKVIAAELPAETAIPVPDVEVAEPSMDFGVEDDFGDGWGSGAGDGSGAGGGGARFFQQEVRAERVLYVIDFSQSMKGEREKLMRRELGKSIEDLGIGMQFQLLMFAGPVWVAGDQVETSGRKIASVLSEGEKYQWKTPGSPYRWYPVGTRQVPDWLPCTHDNLRVAASEARRAELVGGTNWKNPLEMAMRMEPPPQLIVFMTDGAVEGDMMRLAGKLGDEAVSRGIRINTVAMMEPEAENALKELARRTGGGFSIVRKGGKVERVEVR